MEDEKPRVYDLDKEVMHNGEAMDKLRKQLRLSDAMRNCRVDMADVEKGNGP